MNDTIAQLTALLARWDELADTSAAKVETADHPMMGAFYAGVMFGTETARDELAAVVAKLQGATVGRDD